MDSSFPHAWQAEILPARPMILPARCFVYPQQAEEVERGALEVLVNPFASPGLVPKHDFSQAAVFPSFVSANDFSHVASRPEQSRASAPEGNDPSTNNQPFLATCALGFRDAAVPTGLWSCPDPKELCAVSGGYAYIIDTIAPKRFTMISYRPVLEIRVAQAQELLLFVGHHSILAWGAHGKAWESEKLSDEGVTITAIDDVQMHAIGWKMMTDKETSFTLDLRTGLRV